ncbi:AMP-binding protein [Amycolatopsis nalaikhensis]|uniref:AMP-binding protein n=1 Tax=Amycolatopsis nalaikhensis TaxID=715472 RepID=A0ABY8Y0R4_9PSEU|nr:AMP-binding protein [Amycolatopsis sp. 2-2]WIV61579.1 AMP-binding protein [Amycolatopsis sp. 2-2]
MLTSSERVGGWHVAGTGATTLSTLLTARAAADGDRVALTWFGFRAAAATTLTWAELDRRVTAVAAALRQVTEPGQRAAVLIAPSADHVVAVLAVVRAGLVAIPLPPRSPAAIADAGPVIVLATADTVAATRRFLSTLDTCGHRVLAVDAVEDAPGFTEDPVAAEDVAYLQYPAGVMVTHANVVANARQTAAVLQGRTVLSWLPPTDPLGLLLAIAVPIVSGRSAVLVDRRDLLAEPARLLADPALRDIGTLVADTDPDLARLLGALPSDARRVCHVLAEATAVVTAAGVPAGQRIAIVDPGGRRVPDGEPGEIWISGPNIARGYWQRPEESAHVFCALITGDDEPRWWLRSGDLGFLDESGELHVTGRCADLVAGHHPGDLEATAAEAHPAVGSATAFSVGDAQAVIVAELADGVVPPARGEVERAVRAAVSAAHELVPHRVVVVPPGGRPPERARCRDRFAAGLLDGSR